MAELAKAIRLAAMNLLARREHSLAELQQKLTQKFPEADNIDAVLTVLSEENLQSDARFAEAFVRFRANKGFGPVRIFQELQQRGVSQSLSQVALDEADINWLALLAEQYHKKAKSLAGKNGNEQVKIQRYLNYRGFSPEAIRRFVNENSF